MKSQSFVLLVVIALFSFSCVDDLTNIGVGIQPTSDEILLGTETFQVTTENVFVDYMFSSQDSFLLGTFYNEKFGSTQADIFAELSCPLRYEFPPGYVSDSSIIKLYYKSWFGDSYSPMEVSIFEMNKDTLVYSAAYPSNLDVSTYTDRSILLANRLFTAKDATGKRVNKNYIEFKLSNEFVQRFSNDSMYISESKFRNFFKGLYITANFGASTILNITEIELEHYYHHFYLKNGKDSTLTQSVIKFPSYKEAKQVNRFTYPDRNILVKNVDSLNYIASPANIQTRVILPLVKIKQRIDSALLDKKQTFNSAMLSVEATDIEQATLAVPVVSYLLLIREDSVDNFFKYKKLPNKKYAVIGQFTPSRIGTSNNLKYTYNFDLATVIANELKLNANTLKDLKMRLVPVRVKFDAGNNISEVKQQFLMSGVTVKSGKHATSPMRINMLFSGF